ncbi:MAG: peptidylprolyl isomerase [Clostridium sp.]|uniref:peptidylprolyl isomerase n=1 Tax=Clostridium sp. TaxID=1506 RepID=UPI003D6C8465
MKNVKKIICTALITIFATSLIGCNMIEKTPEGIAKSPVAKVYGAEITRGQLDTQLEGVLKQLEAQYGASYATNEEAMSKLATEKEKVLEGLITEKIVIYKAEQLKLTPSEAEMNTELTKKLSEIKKSLGTDEQYKAALTSANITEEALKERIKPSVVQDALYNETTKSAKTDEAAEKAYYTSNSTQFTTQPNTIHVAHILVATQEEAVAVKKRIDAGEDFAKVAKEKGTDATKDSGGEIGTVEYNDAQMDPIFMAAAIKVKVGAISQPVQTQAGFHIIKNIAIKEYPVKKFEDVKSDIQKILINKEKDTQWKAAMTKWQTEAKIKKYAKNL